MSASAIRRSELGGLSRGVDVHAAHLGHAVGGDHAVDVDAGRHDRLRIQLTDVDDLAHLDHGRGRGGGHHRPEVARRLAIDEVAHPVGSMCFDERDVAADRVLEQVLAPVDGALLLALGERRPHAGGGVERADARARGTHPFGEIALRHQLELDLARAVEPVEHPGVRLPRERADHLAHLAVLEQRGQSDVPVAGVVVHHGQVARTRADQRVDQFDGLARGAESSDRARWIRPRCPRPPRPRRRRSRRS